MVHWRSLLHDGRYGYGGARKIDERSGQLCGSGVVCWVLRLGAVGQGKKRGILAAKVGKKEKSSGFAEVVAICVVRGVKSVFLGFWGRLWNFNKKWDA